MPPFGVYGGFVPFSILLRDFHESSVALKSDDTCSGVPRAGPLPKM
jgi:hypothetical protein